MKNIIKSLLNKINYVIITIGDFMKEITYINISKLLDKNCDIENFITEADLLMKEKYPNYEQWFLEKVIPGLITKKRNIIIAYKNNKIVGYANLKNENEKVISNLYVKPGFDQKRIWNSIIDESINWLETYNPKIIISNEYVGYYMSYIMARDWNLTNIKNNDIIFNGKGNEFERLIYKKKLLKK